MSARRKLLVNALKLFDLGLMAGAFVVASLAVLRESHVITFSQFFSMRVKIQNFAIFALLILVWHAVFCMSGLYNSRRLCKLRHEMIDTVRATSSGTLVVFAGALVFNISLATTRLIFLPIFWLVVTLATVFSRLLLYFTLGFIRKRGRNLRNIVIVGTNIRALDFAHKITAHSQIGFRVSGFVDQDWSGLERFQRSGNTLICDLENFPQFLRNSVVDEVAIALPFRSMHHQATRIAASCEEQGISVRVLSNVFDLKKPYGSEEDFESDNVVVAGWAEGWPLIVKRVLDFTISCLAIVLLFPVLLVTVVLVKLTSPGPVFFVQKRLGLNKRRFSVYKFRTMVVDAEDRMRGLEHLNEVSGPVFKIKNDPRITPVGRFLRKTSLDELPQLVNVLVGDMSLVGPRPLPIRDYEGFDKDWQRRRFSVRPGITCLWQVHGRSSIPFDKWMELDLQYIDRWSLWLDFLILLRTIPAVVRGSGAA